MVAIPKTVKNPHGLTIKQHLVIADLIGDIELGKGIDPVKSTQKFYKVKNKESASVIAAENLGRLNFREALIDMLEKKKIIGTNGKVGRVLMEGLDAETITGREDHKTRLAFIQEINKITGAYAPERVDKRSLHLNINVSDEEIHNNINKLQSELGYTT